LAINPRQRLDGAYLRGLRPAIQWHGLRAADALRARAQARGDTFVIYTDSETWAGGSIRFASTGSPPGLPRASWSSVWSRTPSRSPIDDVGMLDVLGFDTATPGVISGFASGAL
jgi:60 kDa SS-A/Ro ribonucleoprotein